MAKPFDIQPGTIFGMSKIVQEMDRQKGRRYFEIECINCGEHVIKKLDDLRRNNRPRTCGKCKFYNGQSRVLKEGENIGGYIFIKELEKVSGNRRVLVYDFQGNEINVSYNSFVNGILKKEINPITTHGMYNTRFYKIYRGMLDRCNNKNATHYDRYGGRGIQCLWDTFEAFKKDMYESYLIHIDSFGKQDTTIERINNNGYYCKENCKWATRKEQQNNRNL